MWRESPLLSWDASIPLLTLCDHNSALVPTHDSEKTPARDSSRYVVDARQREVLCLSYLGLCDAWNIAHPPNETHDELRPKGWTWGFTAPVADSNDEAKINREMGHRRLGRIHVTAGIAPSVSGAYTRFIGGSDHKAVTMQLNFSSEPPGHRWKCRTQFLQGPIACASRHSDLPSLPFAGGWWEHAHQCIKRVDFSHASSHRRIGIAAVGVYVCASSTDYVCPVGTALLKQHG